MGFTYNIADTKNIPGLTRPWETGTPFLTPVFFYIDVLVKYFYNPKYRCEFCSETYGTIECPEEPKFKYSSSFSFGINPNEKVIAWLGDIKKLQPKEIKYLEAHNVASDGDIRSEFYNAQIDIVFTNPIREVEIMLYKTKLSIITEKKFGFRLYKSTEPPLSEVIALCSKYKRIVFSLEDDIKRFLSIWNEDLIEDLNVDGLKKCLNEDGIKFEKGFKGLKLLELFIKEELLITDNIISPLFYLYDLRLWADHMNIRKNYSDILMKLGLPEDSEFSAVYNKLILALYGFLGGFNDILLGI